MKLVESILRKLAELIQQNRFENLESDGLEIKPVPATGSEWRNIKRSINAFLNTRGGIIILGVKEEGAGLTEHDLDLDKLNELEKGGFLIEKPGTRGFLLNVDFRNTHLI